VLLSAFNHGSKTQFRTFPSLRHNEAQLSWVVRGEAKRQSFRPLSNFSALKIDTVAARHLERVQDLYFKNDATKLGSTLGPG